MDRKPALWLFAAWGVGSVFLATAGNITPVAWHAPLALPMAAFTAGPAFLLLLLPHALASDRQWVRVAGGLLPALAVAGAVALAVPATQEVSESGATPLTLRDLLLGGGLLAAVLLSLALVVYRKDPVPWRTALLAGVPLLFLAAFPPTRGVPLLLLGTLEVALLVAVTGFRRPPRAWLRAAAVGVAVLLVEFLGLVAFGGSLAPLRLVLDGPTFEIVAAVLALFAGLVFAVTLYRSDEARIPLEDTFGA